MSLNFLKLFTGETENRELIDLFLMDAEVYGCGRVKQRCAIKEDDSIEAIITEENPNSDRHYKIEVTVSDFPLERRYLAYCDGDGELTEIQYASRGEELKIMSDRLKHRTFERMLSYLEVTIVEKEPKGQIR